MKVLKSFLIFSIVCSAFFTSCGRKVENEYGYVSFYVNNPGRQIESVQEPDFSSYEYQLTAIMGDATNPVEKIVFENGSYEEGQLLFGGESSVEIRTGTWTFRLKALGTFESSENIMAMYEGSTSGSVKSDSILNLSFNMEPSAKGRFTYEITYPKEQNITAESLSVSLVYSTKDDNYGNDFTDFLLDKGDDEVITPNDEIVYWSSVYDCYLPAGVYTLTIEIRSFSTVEDNNVLFHKESNFKIYPGCVTEGKFDGWNMDMNNSFSIEVPSDVNEMLDSMGCTTITKDWYTVYDSIELPYFNKNGMTLSHWYYYFDDDANNLHEIPKNGRGQFIFNEDNTIKGNVTLLFDYTLSGSSENLVKFPQLVELENELMLCSNSMNVYPEPDFISVYPMTSGEKYDRTNCSWELDGNKLDLADDRMIYFNDRDFYEEPIGEWEYIFGNIKKLTIPKSAIAKLSYNNKFSNSYRVNLTCFAKETFGTDYGINSIVVETKVVGPIVFPDDPVPEENYLRFMVLGQNKIELIDSPDYNSGTHQFDQLYAQMDGFALKKLNWDESVDEEVYYYIDSEDFAYTGDDFDVKFKVSNYFKIDEKSGIVVAKNTNGSEIELITSNINAYLTATGKSKSIFTFALPRRELIDGPAQILDIYDSVTYEYWME